MNTPEVRYAKTIDGVNIAYQVRGDGPVDLVYTLGMAGNFEIEFEPPWGVRFLERLASFSRVILFDKRGTGLSDRVLGAPDFDMRADDLRAVLDGAGSERAVLVGNRGGGSLGAFYAAVHPDRVLALVLYNSWARTAWAPDYPVGSSKEELDAWRAEIEAHWGTDELATLFLENVAPSHASDPAWVRWEARALRHGASPAAALAFDEFEQAIDVRSVLATVQAPTLVLSRTEAARARSADLAERIPGARYVHVAGEDWMPYSGDVDALLSEVERFVRSVSAEEATFERVLTTVLFTDVVGSTEKAAESGDGAWKTLVERHHAAVRAMIGRYRGTEVDTAGDGFFATFDGPARAVRCAQAIVEAVRPMGLEVRAGVHTGEVEIIDDKVGGIAVNIGARVAGRAGPSEVLVSQTVKDLVTGSGLSFEDAGEHELKGVPDRWHLYRVVPDVNDPGIRYAKTVDGVHIAYRVLGDGPVDLVHVVGFVGNIEIEFESSFAARFLDRLASFSRVILFDKRGTGLSDRVVGAPDFDMRADDLRAVMDATGSQRSVLFGHSEGGSLAAFFAATHPERVLALVLYASTARRTWAPDYPIGWPDDGEREEWRTQIDEEWGSVEMARAFIEEEAPSHVGDPEWVSWLARAMRNGASPAEALAFEEVQYETDVRTVLPSVQAPTLVLSRAAVDHDCSADLAGRIPGAKHVRVPGKDRIPYAGNIDALLDEVERFVRSVSAEEAAFDRVLATVLFTDIVGSTEKAAALGDTAWKALLARHHETVRAMIGRYRGTEVDTAGDGFFATFDGPARGVKCAQAIAEAVQPLGLEIRAGLHTGEVELDGDDVQGIAVHIGARVGALARPSEALVSQTVKDLVAGSGLTFEDAGEHELKGVPDRWHLYRVVS